MAKNMSINCRESGSVAQSAVDLTPIEANALLIMLDESLEAHFNGFGHPAEWETFDLDAARLNAYRKFRIAYTDCFHLEEK